MPSTSTYTYAYTRAQAVVDQISVLFSEAGIDGNAVEKVCGGVQERWVEAVGLYLERDSKRVYEIEATIDWPAHSQNATIAFSTDLPGWDANASPEALVLGRRFAGKAVSHSLEPRYWVRFTQAIRNDPGRHQELCPQVGVVYQGRVPNWGAEPLARALPVQDLSEMGFAVRSTL
jgi:hypothetical protein